MDFSVENFISEKIDWIDHNRWDWIYRELCLKFQSPQIGRFSRMMLEAGINPLDYLNFVPTGFFWSNTPQLHREFAHIIIPDHIKQLNTRCFANANYIKQLSLPDGMHASNFIFENTRSIEKLEFRTKYIDEPKYCLTYRSLTGQLPRGMPDIIFTNPRGVSI